MKMRWCLLAWLWLLPSQGDATAPVLATASASARINIEFQDADIHHVLRTFADLGRVNIIAEKGVSGRVSATFRSTTWREALGTVLRSQGLEAEQDGNIIYVRPGC